MFTLRPWQLFWQPRVWFAGVLFWVGLMMSPGNASDDLFEQFTLDIGGVHEPTVISAFLSGGDIADIVVIGIRDRRRHLSVYSFEGHGWAEANTGYLPDATRFVDVANINGQEHLIALVDGRVVRLQLPSLDLIPMAETPVRFRGADPWELPRLRVMRDLNGNGRDDLVMPDVDGFWISLQQEDGRFTPSTKLGPAEPYRDQTMFGDKQTYGEAAITTQTLPWYLSRLHVADFNGNGLTDLTFWDQGDWVVHPQGSDGSFQAEPERYSMDVPFDTDGMYSVAFQFKENFFRLATGLRPRTEITVLTDIRDISGDGVPDLTTVTLTGRSVFRLKSAFRVHRGRRSGTGLVFDDNNVTEITPDYKGTAWTYSNLSLHDDAVGNVLVQYINVPTDIGQLYRVFFRNTMSVHLAVYSFDDGMAASPARQMKIKPAYDRVAKKGPFFPATLLGDVTGDGRLDLLVGHSWNTLHIYPGNDTSPTSFSDTPIALTVPMTSNENNTRLAKLTRGSAMGLLVEHYGDAEDRRLHLLLPRRDNHLVGQSDPTPAVP